MDLLSNGIIVMVIGLIGLLFNVYYNYKKYGNGKIYSVLICIMMLVCVIANFIETSQGLKEYLILGGSLIAFIANIYIIFILNKE
ncbi:MAG: hypothetical protein PHH04_01150 [Thomasclavelia sp.]|nr:hypothetical protein [Thomasclavelia sp.]